ncbi:MAG: hypothetical protein KBD63_04330 [Bacteriovoracaceae bacterium]|nr:hypothetical protein [Bacteriovoracaceae bacterium]
MNFNFLLFLFLSFFLSSCGVKGPPRAPKNTAITPWDQKYIQEYETFQKEKEQRKKKL